MNSCLTPSDNKEKALSYTMRTTQKYSSVREGTEMFKEHPNEKECGRHGCPGRPAGRPGSPSRPGRPGYPGRAGRQLRPGWTSNPTLGAQGLTPRFGRPRLDAQTWFTCVLFFFLFVKSLIIWIGVNFGKSSCGVFPCLALRQLLCCCFFFNFLAVFVYILLLWCCYLLILRVIEVNIFQFTLVCFIGHLVNAIGITHYWWCMPLWFRFGILGDGFAMASPLVFYAGI